jgi:hypothetical protein
MSAAIVHVLDDALQEPLVLVRIEGFHVVLPPHLGLDLRPGDGEGVVDRAPGAGGIGIEDERTVYSQLRGKRLLLGVRTALGEPAPVVLDSLAEELVLGQVVLIGYGCEPELALEGVANIHYLSPLRDA